MTQQREDEVDPDPFGIGIGLFAAMVSGASFLERADRRSSSSSSRAAFRAAWFEARRSVIFFKRSLDEFETYVLEDGYGRRAFRVGSVRLTVTPRRAHEMKRLRGQALTTAQRLGDNLDELSNFLGQEDHAAVTSILADVTEFGSFPDRYADLITQGRSLLAVYTELLDVLAERERFDEDTESYSVG